MQVGITDGDTLSDFKDRKEIARGSESNKNEGAGWLSASGSCEGGSLPEHLWLLESPSHLTLLSLKTHSLALTQPLCFLLTLSKPVTAPSRLP